MSFYDESSRNAFWSNIRKPFFIAVISSFVLLQILFLGNLCYLYGALFRSSHHTKQLDVLFVDYDQGVVGESLRQAVASLSGDTFPTIHEHTSSGFDDPTTIRDVICRGDYWAAVYATENASLNLEQALIEASAAQDYDPTSAIVLVWNEMRYPVVAEANIYGNMQLLFATTRSTYYASNLTAILQNFNIMDEASRGVLLNPIDYATTNLAETPQGTRVLYNTASVVMFTLMQFFFVLATNGIANGFQIYVKVPAKKIIVIRLAFSITYTFVGALLSVAYIWAFKEDWSVGGVQLLETWMILWVVMHINYLVLDAVAATLPMPFIPFFTFTWIILNITSTVMPFDISVGFYRIGYIFPAHSLWEILIQIWSKGCYNRLSRALPIIFAWELLSFCLDTMAQWRKARLAVQADVLEGVHSASQVSQTPKVEGDRDIPSDGR